MHIIKYSNRIAIERWSFSFVLHISNSYRKLFNIHSHSPSIPFYLRSHHMNNVTIWFLLAFSKSIVFIVAVLVHEKEYISKRGRYKEWASKSLPGIYVFLPILPICSKQTATRSTIFVCLRPNIPNLFRLLIWNYISKHFRLKWIYHIN